MTERNMCTTGDHGDVPAAGEAQVEDDPTWYPYCVECLLLCDPPRRWYGEPPPGEPAELDSEQDQRLVRAVEEVLLASGARLQALHHVHVRLDANARHLIAELAVTALLDAEINELREAQEDANVEVQIATTKMAAAERERDRLNAEVTDLGIQSMDSEGEYHDLRDERDRLLAAMKYLRALAHLFPHTNTDQAHEAVGLPDDAPGVWCLGCSIGATVDDVTDLDRQFFDGVDADEERQLDARARQWVQEYEERHALAVTDE